MRPILDERGYPPGYEPKGWHCPSCGGMFHDSAEKGDPMVAWEMPPECGRCGEIMVPDQMVTSDTEAKP